MGSIDDVDCRGIGAYNRCNLVLSVARDTPNDDFVGDNSVGRGNRCVFGGDDAMTPEPLQRVLDGCRQGMMYGGVRDDKV